MKLDERSRMKSSYKIPNIDRVLKANDYYVGHEYLESINDPMYVSEFVKRAESQGCAYVGDECMQRSFITWLPDATVTNIKKLAQDNRVDKEQYFDYVYDTQFRMALLTKQSNADKITQNETVTKDILDGLYFLITLDTDLGVPPEWTDTVHIAIKEMMDTRLPSLYKMWSTILNINIRAMTSIWISFIRACSCSLSSVNSIPMVNAMNTYHSRKMRPTFLNGSSTILRPSLKMLAISI